MAPRSIPLYIVQGVTFRTLRGAIAHARNIGGRQSIRITWER